MEKNVSDELIKEGVEYEYEKTIFTLLPSFVYNKSKIRPVTYKPDFMDPTGKKWLIEVKGLETADFKIKWKMLKKYLHDKEDPLRLYLIKSVRELREIIPELRGQNKEVLRERESIEFNSVKSIKSKTVQKVKAGNIRLPRAKGRVSARLSSNRSD